MLQRCCNNADKRMKQVMADTYQALGMMRRESEVCLDFVFQNVISRTVQRNMNRAGSVENNMTSCDIILEYVLAIKPFIPNNEKIL